MTYDVKLRDRILYKDGSWNTLCLPFTLDSFTGTIFASSGGCEVRYMDKKRYLIRPKEGEPYGEYYTGVQDGQLYLFFNQATGITAGGPYIVKWDRVSDYDSNDPGKYDYLSPTFNDVTISYSPEENNLTISDDGKVTFKGTFAPFIRDYLDPSILFLGVNDKLYYPSGAGPATVGPFRAYFQLNGVQMADGGGSGSGSDDEYIPAEGGGDARAFVLSIIDEATGIVEMRNEKVTTLPSLNGEGAGEGLFTLDGRKLDNVGAGPVPARLHKGIYIYNGRKVVIK